jgi:methylated-DNA-[protein]-cysteine S-methyltransferase
MALRRVATPIGNLSVIADRTGVREIRFAHDARALPEAAEDRFGTSVAATAAAQLEQYFGGLRREFTLPLAPEGDAFQRLVWQELQRIPFGATVSYGEIARRIGDARAARAVGAANGRNPIPIVIPCHRVIGADGSLTGYGGGLELKRWLLRHEGALPEGDLFDSTLPSPNR